MKKTLSTDVVIVGGGIIGCATAYYLARKGKKCIVIERDYVASQGSGRNAGGVRAQGRLPAELPIVLEAIELWKKLDNELDIKTEYRQTGNVFLASTEKEMELHHKMSARLQREGLKEVRVIDEAETLRVIPALRPGACKGGSYCTIDGMANPLNTTFGYAYAAKRYGADVLEHTKVDSIDVEHGCVQGVVTSDLSVRGKHVLLACGSWTDTLAAKLGLSIPITPCRNQLFVTEMLPPLVKPFLLAPTVYCNQTYNGNMFVGNVDPDDYCLGNSANPNETKKIARDILKYIPSLGNASIIRTWGGPLDLTPDDMPILGDVPCIEGLVLACGFSGHGFASAPYIGKILAEHIALGRSSLDLSPFSLTRFLEGHTSTNNEELYAYGQAVGKNRE